MKISRFLAPVGADPQHWLDWISDVAAVLGIPDPTTYTPPIGPDGQPLPSDPNKIERMAFIQLEDLPEPLLPPGVDPVNRSIRWDMIIVKVMKLVATGEIDDFGQPIYDSVDNGWQSDLIISVGPGLPWDVSLMPPFMTETVIATGETIEHETETRGTLTLPAIPDQWAAVIALHPDRVYAVWTSTEAVNIPEAP